MSTLTTVYATDEDLSVLCREDYPLLVPPDQIVADGVDGVVQAGTPWLLESATAAFLAQGVTAGQVCLLTKPIARFRPPGELLAVASVDASGATLRRRAQAAGVTGKPLATAAGLTAVEFKVLTLFPQIEAAAYQVNRLIGVDDRGLGYLSTQLWDPRELRTATCYHVLWSRYLDCAHLFDDQDTYKRKHDRYKQLWEEAAARLSVRLVSSPGAPQTAGRAARAVR